MSGLELEVEPPFVVDDPPRRLDNNPEVELDPVPPEELPSAAPRFPNPVPKPPIPAPKPCISPPPVRSAL
jgi:hypothetical protein